MSYQMKATVEVFWVGDGTGSMNVESAQSLRAFAAPILVPGGNSPSSGNLTTAATTIGTNLGTALTTAANLATIQGWSTGGP